MADERYDYSEFIPLDDLVYAPLHALARSNEQLRARVVDTIKNMGTLRQNGKEETVQLSNMNIAYEQIRPEGEEGTTWTISKCRCPSYPLFLLRI